MYFVIWGFLFILPKHKHTSCVKLFLFLLKKFLLLLLMFGKQNKAKSQDGKLGSGLIKFINVRHGCTSENSFHNTVS